MADSSLIVGQFEIVLDTLKAMRKELRGSADQLAAQVVLLERVERDVESLKKVIHHGNGSAAMTTQIVLLRRDIEEIKTQSGRAATVEAARVNVFGKIAVQVIIAVVAAAGLALNFLRG